jgi:hypothetical protein
LTILPPNLCSSNSGIILRGARREDVVPPIVVSGDGSPDGGSRSSGSGLSTSEGWWVDGSPCNCRPLSSVLIKAHSPFSGPPTAIHPYPAAKHRGSNGMTAMLSLFCAAI